MVYCLVIVAICIEEDQISLTKIALADCLAGRFLITSAPFQLDSDLLEDEFREGRAIEY